MMVKGKLWADTDMASQFRRGGQEDSDIKLQTGLADIFEEHKNLIQDKKRRRKERRSGKGHRKNLCAPLRYEETGNELRLSTSARRES